jgi:hypothetical protein
MPTRVNLDRRRERLFALRVGIAGTEDAAAGSGDGPDDLPDVPALDGDRGSGAVPREALCPTCRREREPGARR